MLRLALLLLATGTHSLGHGAWSWFGDPRAITHGSRTYIGWVDNHGGIRIAAYDRRTRRVTQGPVLKHLGRDDHNNPSILIRPDGRLMVFFSPHSGRYLPAGGGPSEMYYRVSRRPGDVRRFGRLHTIPTNTPGPLGYTYANPLLRGRTVFMFWRGGNWLPSMSTWRAGRGWSRARTVIKVHGDNRPYVKYALSGRRGISLAFTEGNPGEVTRSSIFYARLERGRFGRADGSRAGRLPITPSRADRVYNGHGRGGKAWVLDTAIGAGGRPVILFVSYPAERRAQNRYAVWTGKRWRVRRIGPPGPTLARNYPAGGMLDHEDPSVVLLSRQVRGHFEIERWHTRDGGRHWTSSPVTSGSSEDNVRPVVPWGRPHAGIVLWMRGSYPGWTTYMTRIELGRVAKPTPLG